MKLGEIMNRHVIQIEPSETIATAAARMFQSAVGCLVVTVAQSVKGIITDRDALTCVANKHDPYACRLSMHMHHPVIVMGADETVAAAADVLRRKHIKRLPVAHKGKLLGLVSLSDMAAVASAQAERFDASLDFFTSVVRAQAPEHNLPQRRAGESPPGAAADSNNGNGGSQMPDAGPA